ncbi:MAG: TIGR01440 family protein [Ruminococcaceae bacterium]|nr:TIGR01440 family protein [Oscillospiraceae bacterium]
MKQLQEQAKTAVSELIEKANLKRGDLLVIGCSTSEIIGSKIGSNSSPDTAQGVFEAIYKVLQAKGIFLAAQCCEHLNRALIVEAEIAEKYGWDEVNVVPQPKAGGSFATAAYHAFKAPVAVENVRAKAGLDIGGTLIGMHLQPVAVPLRLSIKQIGEAPIICARTRPKFIGGERAHYNDNLK